jgi:hypothetical protein
MPQISRLSGADPTNIVSIGRLAQTDVAQSRASYAAWLAANPTATPVQVATAIQTAIAALWPSAPVQIRIHIFDLATPTIGVHIANLGETIPAQWWVIHP